MGGEFVTRQSVIIILVFSRRAEPRVPRVQKILTNASAGTEIINDLCERLSGEHVIDVRCVSASASAEQRTRRGERK